MDLMQREGQYPLPPQASKTIMGVEFAGTVSKMGEGTSKFKEGDEVFGLAFGVSSSFAFTLYQLLIWTALCVGDEIAADVQGAYAEYIVSPENMLLTKPKELSWVQAAALPENWMTGELASSNAHE